jgi:hypothetical protein
MIYGVASQELKASEFKVFARTCSACAGVGESLALIIGPFFFSIGGYFMPYISLFGVLVILGFIFLISGVLNETPQASQSYVENLLDDNTIDVESSEPEPEVTLKWVMSIPVNFISLIIIVS